jgi:hypothetical protein
VLIAQFFVFTSKQQAGHTTSLERLDTSIHLGLAQNNFAPVYPELLTVPVQLHVVDLRVQSGSPVTVL